MVKALRKKDVYLVNLPSRGIDVVAYWGRKSFLAEGTKVGVRADEASGSYVIVGING